MFNLSSISDVIVMNNYVYCYSYHESLKNYYSIATMFNYSITLVQRYYYFYSHLYY